MLDGHADGERTVAMAIASGQAGSYDLDALVVSDRFRLFNFTRRDDHVAYLWVLRAPWTGSAGGSTSIPGDRELASLAAPSRRATLHTG